MKSEKLINAKSGFVKSSVLLSALFLLAAMTSAPVTAQPAPGACGPIDLVIVLDETGSMGGAIDNIKSELPTIISTANAASGGDLHLAYVTFRDDVTVHQDLSNTNTSAVEASINATFALGGGDLPEPSDEAKNTVINNLPTGVRADVKGINGTQAGDFIAPWRANATKIAVLITDSPPNGFGESVYPGGDAAYNMHMNSTLPAMAAAKGILFSDVFVNTSGDYGSDISSGFTGVGQAELLAADANGTGGVFTVANPDGTGTGAAITAIIEKCGAEEPRGSISGVKFNDLNGNGTMDAGELGLANWTITLTDASGNVVTLLTDSSGAYNFTNIASGNYTVAEVQQIGWEQTAPSTITYSVEVTDGEAIIAKDFGNMRIPPNASCVESVNPSGKKIPPAGYTTQPGTNPKSGQNPDGFYQLLASGPAGTTVQIFVNDTGSGTIFGPFANGTNIKYVQAPGATPNISAMGGPNSAVQWQIKGIGDLAVYAVDSNGANSTSVSCLVPPPPK